MPVRKKIVLDTNFLLIPGQFGVDIFSEIKRIVDFGYQLVIVEKTIEELQKLLETGKKQDKQASKLAISLLETQNIKRDDSHSHKNADDSIVDISDADTYVATQDRVLRERVKKKGAKIIGLRQKKYLIIE